MAATDVQQADTTEHGTERFGRIHVSLTFRSPLLGTAPLNPDLFEDFVGMGLTDESMTQPGKALEEMSPEERDALQEFVDEEIQRKSTGFHRINGSPASPPALYDYQIKGFLKEACTMLRRAKGYVSGRLAANRKVLDGLVFVEPRMIPLVLPEGESTGWLVRPLRGQTARGERVALMRSEIAPEGTRIGFDVLAPPLKGKDSPGLRELLTEWLDYGWWHGIGQWRSGGYGRFNYTLED